MNRPLRVALTGVVAATLAVATGCGGGSGEAKLGRRVENPASTAVATPSSGALRAQAIKPNVAIYDEPGDATPSRELDNPWVVDPEFPDQTVSQVFLVKTQRADGWVQVLLPIRPNGSTGWIRANDVRITPVPFRIKVELGAHRITVMENEKVLYQGPIAIGTPDTPTPTGEYYLRVTVQALDPNTVYGPYAWGLSSHSDVLESFNGGDGEIGIHGNNDASVLGTDVTHGCVRMDNDAITSFARRLPLGTPVDIVA